MVAPARRTRSIVAKLGAIVPAAEFFEHNAFDVVGDARLTQSSQDAACRGTEYVGIGEVDARPVEADENLRQLVIELATARLEARSGVFCQCASSTRLWSGPSSHVHTIAVRSRSAWTWPSTDPELQAPVSRTGCVPITTQDPSEAS